MSLVNEYDIRPSSTFNNVEEKELIKDYNKLYNNVIEYEEYKHKYNQSNLYSILGKMLVIFIVTIIFLFLFIKIINLITRKECSIDEDINKGLDYKKSDNLLCKTEKLIDNIANIDKIFITNFMRDKNGHKKYLYNQEIGNLIYNKPNNNNNNNDSVTISEILYNKN